MKSVLAIVGTLLTLFVIPVLYVIVAGWRDRRAARRSTPSEGESELAAREAA